MKPFWASFLIRSNARLTSSSRQKVKALTARKKTAFKETESEFRRRKFTFVAMVGRLRSTTRCHYVTESSTASTFQIFLSEYAPPDPNKVTYHKKMKTRGLPGQISACAPKALEVTFPNFNINFLIFQVRPSRVNQVTSGAQMDAALKSLGYVMDMATAQIMMTKHQYRNVSRTQ